MDRLLAEKLQLEQQVEELTRELGWLRDRVGGSGARARVHVWKSSKTLRLWRFLTFQLVLEAEDKEALLKSMSKQSKNMSKIKRGESAGCCCCCTSD